MAMHPLEVTVTVETIARVLGRGRDTGRVEIDDTDIPESTGADSLYAWLARWDQS